MIKHSIVMTVEDYFLVKNYLIKLKKEGKLDNDNFLQKFYTAFALDSSLKLERHAKLFDNPTAVVELSLDNSHTLLATIGLFCREHAIDQNRNNPQLAKALNIIKDYMSAELMDLNNY